MATSVSDLKKRSVGELLALFKSLEPPTIEEMHGEYAATMLRQPSTMAKWSGAFLQFNPVMPWLCKAFRPVNSDSGRGYNTFRLLGRVVQRYPMHTLIAPSRYDGKPAYQLVYRVYHSMCGDIHMVDELRRVRAGLYLGIGTWGFSDKQRQIALPFALEVTGDAYRGDIGVERKGCVVAKEIPALRK